MGKEIHAIERPGKRFFYRVYSNVSDTYETPQLTKREVMKFILFDYAYSRLRSLSTDSLNIQHRLANARKNGTSSIGDKRSLKRWDDKPQDYWGINFPIRKTKEAFLEDLEGYLQTPLNLLIKRELKYGRHLNRDSEVSIKQIDDLMAIVKTEDK